ncbi:isochorismatase family protein [Aerophototrophica crusticola]|uniref:isochorismatase family protein n=1 Tax=Aerophototrophica crusticola TaxID=1709002 RepID=UPI003850F1ED
MHPTDTDVLILIDIQNDFCPGGALAVPDGDAVVPVANALVRRFRHVVLTQDWHAPNMPASPAATAWHPSPRSGWTMASRPCGPTTASRARRAPTSTRGWRRPRPSW